MRVAERRINALKRKIDKELMPLKVQLMQRKGELPGDKWMRLVYTMKRSVLANPSEYLTGNLPDKDILIPSIDRVFKGFLEDQKIRDAQKRFP